MFSYLTVRDVRVLAETSSGTALAAADCLVTVYAAHRVPVQWRMAYTLYLRARYAADDATDLTLRQLPFVPRLSRACRGCGVRTQRKVFNVLLCSVCTRNPNMRHAWMVPAVVARKLRAYTIPFHSGPRGPLVLAAHITAATGATRKQIKELTGK